MGFLVRGRGMECNLLDKTNNKIAVPDDRERAIAGHFEERKGEIRKIIIIER